MMFARGNFTLHSGGESSWKIDCDDLSDGDLRTLAWLIGSRLSYDVVIGIPNGGLRFAAALERYSKAGYPTLIADDVLTTGQSMEEARKYHPNAHGVVIFARGPCPEWVIPIFETRFI